MATIALTLTLALTLPGCKKKAKTTVVFVNATNGAVGIVATFGTPVQTFDKVAVPIGAIASQTYKTKEAKGTLLPITGNLDSPLVAAPFPIPAGLTVTAGKTNVFTLTGDVTVDPPVVSLTQVVQ